ncbi:helix-turn-helix domain-containing protein [Rodentibacter haemolyticus]|uniref:Helix-turn-helix transcriptional regulator n=1 Tax=Rodentibacter haemolyticus TaxID=2778911 RepID=A0ABX6UXJ7_9PAST|nr:helix-turn-helix transcriptional regulator [Rodentibacter haemolyticus]QPB41806.1 helix-turn-helix transcriptional regulator [Rodentibacter haemolyticus]
MEIHEKIRVMREINQWSQEEMAEKLDMSPTGYAKIERGQSSLNLDKLKQIAAIFDIDLVELIATQDRSFFFSIGDNSNNHSYIAVPETLALENQALKQLLQSRDSEIAALKEIIELLKSNPKSSD